MSDGSFSLSAAAPFRRARLESGLVVIAVIAATLHAWAGWCAFPNQCWNDLRLVPAFALRFGAPLYPPLGGGPLTTWIYGPVGAVINLPATLAPSTTSALMLAGVINLLTLGVPSALLCLGTSAFRELGWQTRLLGCALGLLWLSPASLAFQVADHACVAFGALSCFVLARRTTPTRGDLSLAAAAAVLAIATKQPAVFLLPAQLFFLWRHDSRATAGRYLGWLAALGVVAFVASVRMFGFDELVLNLWTIPARLPWASLSDRLAGQPLELITAAVLPWLVLAWLRARGRFPAADTDAGRYARLCCHAGIAVAPIGLIAFFKIGGGLNSLESWHYLAPVFLACVLTGSADSLRAKLVLLAVLIALHASSFTKLPGGPQTALPDLSEKLARANPGAIWFPMDPLVTFYAEGVFYQTEDGVTTRALAGFLPQRAEFRRYLPRELHAIVHPRYEPISNALQLVPEFSHAEAIGPWIVHTPGGATTPLK